MKYYKSATIFFIVFACFALAGSARADSYYAEGILKSKNVLSGAEITEITNFQVAAEIPASTTVSVSFSQDREIFYSASGTKGAWTDCTNGTTTVDLSELSWSGALLFYKLKLTTASSTITPKVTAVKVEYDGGEVPPAAADLYYNQGIMISKNLLAGADVTAVTGFRATTTLPAGTRAFLSFSQDKSLFYSASGTKAGWDELNEGGNFIDLSGLGWSAASIYYKVKFDSFIDPAATAKLTAVKLEYEGTDAPPLSGVGYETSGSFISTNLMDIGSTTLTGYERFAYAISTMPYGSGATVQFSRDGETWYSADGALWGADALSFGDHISPDQAISLSALGWRGAESFYYKINLTAGIDNHTSPIIKTAGLITYSAVMGRPGEGTAVRMGSSSPYCVPGSTDYCAAPVGEWKFDEKTGTTTYDTSGNGNDGTLVNGPEWTRGKFGSALRFDGVDDYVNHQTILSVMPNSLSIVGWFKPDITGMSSDMMPLGKVNNSVNDSLSLLFKMSGSNPDSIRFYYCVDGGCDTLDSQIAWTNNTWYFLAITWDTINGINLYINGEMKVNNVFATSLPNDGVYKNFTIGALKNDGTNRPFKGIIDQVRIYNYARTPAQIAWEYNKGKPIAEWRFDECQGSTIHDESGNGNHGQLYLGSSGVTATGTCASSSNSFWYNGRTGKVNSAGSFDGEDDYVIINDHDSLDFGTGDFSYSLWVKTTQNCADNKVFMGQRNQDSSRPSSWIGCNTDGDFALSYTDSNSIGGQINSNRRINDDRWHHVVGVKRGHSGAVVELYVDGELAVSAGRAYTGHFNYAASGGNQPNSIGRFNASPYYEYAGLIDDVKIWNYALTAEQVKMEYSGGAVRFGE